jgi:GTP-sensing pleiotropic transcriptional regulator CodY
MTIDIQGILCQKPTTGQERGYVEEKYLVRTMSNIAKSGDALIDKFEKASERGIQAAIDDELDSLREDVGLQRQITTDLAKIVEVSAEVINRNGNITNMKKDHKKIKERRLQLKKEKQVLATVSDNLNNLKEKVASIASKTNELTAEVQQIKKKHPKK